MSRHRTARGHGHLIHLAGERPAATPPEPEYRDSTASPAPGTTADQLVAQLLADPEFEQRRLEEAHGVLW